MPLTDHVIVLDHLQPQVVSGPPTQSYEDALRLLGVPDEAIVALPEVHRRQRVGKAGKAVVSHAALDISGSGIATEVAWPCGCGASLHIHHDFALTAWARHVAELEGVDADHLERHAIAAISAAWRPDATPRVYCRCDEQFTAAGHLPDDALAAWERHVREVPR